VGLNHAVSEAAFTEQLEIHARIVGKGFSAGSYYHGIEEQVDLVT